MKIQAKSNPSLSLSGSHCKSLDRNRSASNPSSARSLHLRRRQNQSNAIKSRHSHLPHANDKCSSRKQIALLREIRKQTFCEYQLRTCSLFSYINYFLRSCRVFSRNNFAIDRTRIIIGLYVIMLLHVALRWSSTNDEFE